MNWTGKVGSTAKSSPRFSPLSWSHFAICQLSRNDRGSPIIPPQSIVGNSREQLASHKLPWMGMWRLLNLMPLTCHLDRRLSVIFWVGDFFLNWGLVHFGVIVIAEICTKVGFGYEYQITQRKLAFIRMFFSRILEKPFKTGTAIPWSQHRPKLLPSSSLACQAFALVFMVPGWLLPATSSQCIRALDRKTKGVIKQRIRRTLLRIST